MDAVISVTTDNYSTQVNKEGKAAIIFVGNPEVETGKSWCSDCVEADPVLKSSIPKLQAAGYTVYYCLAGDKETWKDENNKARKSDWIQVNSIPTLLLVQDYKEVTRLEEDKLFTSEALDNLLKA